MINALLLCLIVLCSVILPLADFAKGVRNTKVNYLKCTVSAYL